MPGPTYRHSPFRFRSPDAILASARRHLEREENISQAIDRLQAFRFSAPRRAILRPEERYRAPTAAGQFISQTDPDTLKYIERARRFGINLEDVGLDVAAGEPPTLLGGRDIDENVPQRRIFGQEAQAFAEQVAPREHQRRLISEADVRGLGLPGQIAREASYVDPATLMLAPLVGPSVFGRGAVAGAAPTFRQLTGTALSAVGADLPVGLAQLGRAGARRLASSRAGIEAAVEGVAPLRARGVAVGREAGEDVSRVIPSEGGGVGRMDELIAEERRLIAGPRTRETLERLAEIDAETRSLLRASEGGAGPPRVPISEGAGAVPPGRPPSGPALPEPPVGPPEEPLGGFPERFAGKARRLEGGPPRPRGTEPPIGVGEVTWESAIDKLDKGIRTSGRRLAKTEIERSADRGRRIAEYQNVVRTERAAGRPGSEALRKANSALQGEYAKFEGPAFGLNEAESEAIWARAADFDYGRKAFNQKHVSDALLRIQQGEPLRRFEISALRRVYGPKFAKTLEKKLVTGSNWDKIANSITIPRTVLSAVDVSYPLRQGIKVSVRHPKEFWGNIKPMIKSFASEGVTEHIDDALRTDPLPIQVTNADGSISSTNWGQVMQDTDMLRPLPDAEAHFLSREEGFLSNVANKFPLVRNSARSFITYGNKLRADIGKYWVQRWIRNGEDITPERLDALGNVLNRFTGRGTLGKNVVAEAIQTLGWAPKLTISGPQAALQMFHSDPLIRKIAIENMVSFTAGGVGLLSLAKLSGAADVSLEPGPDFGKMRFGNLRINIFGSDQVLARTIYQIASGKSVNYLTGVSPVDTKTSIMRYLRGRLSPEGSLLTDIMAGKNYIGEEMNWDPKTFWREAPQRLIPLAAQDIYDTWQNQGPLAALTTAPLTLLGLPTSAYETAGQKLAAAYNEKVEGGEFGPSAKSYKDETPTTRKFNISQNEELQDLDASRNIAIRKEIEVDKAGLESEYRLPDAARRILAGENIGSQFVKDFEEYQDKMQGIYFDKYAAFDPSNDSAEERALQAYRDISPNDPRYRDPTTNEPLWDDFKRDKDIALARLSPELQRALKEALKSLDPDVQKVEAMMKQARELYSQSFDYPKYAGLSSADEKELDEFVVFVRAEVRRAKLQNPDFALSTPEAARILGQRNGNSKLGEDAAVVIQGKAPVNEERLDFLDQNQDILARFFPSLYRSIELQRRLNPAALEAVLQ